MKQSNWTLGIGILVAILIIVGSLFIMTTSEPSEQNTVKQGVETEVGQLFKHAAANQIAKFSVILKANY